MKIVSNRVCTGQSRRKPDGTTDHQKGQEFLTFRRAQIAGTLFPQSTATFPQPSETGQLTTQQVSKLDSLNTDEQAPSTGKCSEKTDTIKEKHQIPQKYKT